MVSRKRDLEREVDELRQEVEKLRQVGIAGQLSMITRELRGISQTLSQFVRTDEAARRGLNPKPIGGWRGPYSIEYLQQFFPAIVPRELSGKGKVAKVKKRLVRRDEFRTPEKEEGQVREHVMVCARTCHRLGIPLPLSTKS